MNKDSVIMALSLALIATIAVSWGGDNQEIRGLEKASIFSPSPELNKEIKKKEGVQDTPQKESENEDKKREKNKKQPPPKMTEEEMVEMFEGLWGPADESDSQRKKSDILSEENVTNIDTKAGKDLEKKENPQEKKEEAHKNQAITPILYLESKKGIEEENKALSINRPARKEEIVIKKELKITDAEKKTILVKKEPKKRKKEKPKPPQPELKTNEPRPAIPEIQIDTILPIYSDGTFVGTGNYEKNGKQEKITISVVLVGTVVKNIQLLSGKTGNNEIPLQEIFFSDVKSYILGEKINQIPRFSSVGGGSAIPIGFHRAIESIRAQSKQ